jgi:hypothetical protein
MHQLAHHLQSAGRGEDKVLVHMTPKEVNGLQALAMAHGGSLTINPKTGLPEAGILSSLLPMVAGFFLGPAGLQLTAMQSALTVGALGTAATGSLGKGFMMGLGAYGGAGLGEGLVKVGAPANVTPSVTDPTLGGFPQNQTLANAGVGPKIAPDTITGNTLGGADTFGNVAKEAGLKPLDLNNVPAGMGQGNPNSIMFKAAPEGYITNTSPMGNYVSNMKADMLNPIQPNVVPSAPTVTNMSPKLDIPRPVDAGSNLSRGFDRATSSFEGAKEVWDATPKGTGYGLAATGMSALQAQQEEAAKKAKSKADALAAERRGYMRPYDFSTEQDPRAYANTSTAENRYFVEPRFTARPIEKIAKEGGLMSLAVGGPVEQMSAQNAVGANTGYPMAHLQTPMYSNPMAQRPMSTNLISPSGDAGVNTYSGEQRMALGGTATASAKAPSSPAKYTYDPATMKYTQITSTPATTPQDTSFGGMAKFMLGSGIGAIGSLLQNSTNPLNRAVGKNFSSASQGLLPSQNITTQTMGGTTTPYVPQNQEVITQTPAPAINIPAYQTPEQQLGLEDFYNRMSDQLAMKGAQMQAQGYADGGVARFGNGGMGFTPEGQAKRDYLKSQGIGGQNGPRGIMRTIPDDEWARIKKENNISIPSAASATPSYNYNPVTMQYTDNAGKVTGGMAQPFMPPMMLQQMTPEQQIGLTGYQGYAMGGSTGGISDLGSYSDGGRLLRGPGDGVSDSIPASIGDRQPARLADGEFVVPARIVSEIGNGSTEAGARKLYAMMDRVQKARKKTVGKNQVAKNTKADKLLPA